MTTPFRRHAIRPPHGSSGEKELLLIHLQVHAPTDPPAFEGDGDAAYMFQRLFDLAAKEARPDQHTKSFVMESYHVEGKTWQYPSNEVLDRASAIMITGGSMSSCF